MNDIVGVNTRTFELAAPLAPARWWTSRRPAQLFKPGEEIVGYRDLGELRRLLDYHLAHPDEARAIGENARAARSPSTRCATGSRRCWRRSLQLPATRCR